MNFKKSMTLAASVAAIMGTNGAFAFGPATVHDVDVYMSGATAMEKGIGDTVTDQCQDTLDFYTDNGSNPGAAQKAYSCTMGTSAGFTGTKTVLFHKRNTGGSALGVNPLLENTQIDYMVISSTNCTETAAGSHTWRCGIVAGVGLASHLSDGGVSDVNPEMFVGDNTPVGFLPVNPLDVTSKLVVTPAQATIFGAPVTVELYRALQEAQVAAGTLDAACLVAAPAAPIYTEACMPSMTKAELTSIFAGRLRTWDKFRVKTTAGVDVPLTSFNVGSTDSNLVTICRRVAGSGTQATTNMYFLGNPCLGNAKLSPIAENGQSGTLGPIVEDNSGSGNVETCLVEANNGTTNFVTSNTNFGKRLWAVGVQSLEFNSGRLNNGVPDTAGLKNYRFIKINGQAPTLENTKNGKYEEWVESTCQYLSALPVGSDKRLFLASLCGNMGKATILGNTTNGTNLQFLHPFGQSGLMALGSNAVNIPSFPFVATNPVITLTHRAGTNLDNCRLPSIGTITGNRKNEVQIEP